MTECTVRIARCPPERFLGRLWDRLPRNDGGVGAQEAGRAPVGALSQIGPLPYGRDAGASGTPRTRAGARGRGGMDRMDGMDVATPRLRDQAGGLNGYAGTKTA